MATEPLSEPSGDDLEPLPDDDADDHLSLFDDVPAHPERARAADGSEPGIVPVALGGTGAVALLVALLSGINTGLLEPFTFVMAAVAVVLLWSAWATRIVPTDVSVSGGGVVSVVRKGDTHRFDLGSTTVRVEVTGRPGDAGWRVRLYRRALDPVDVDATMVDPDAFLALLRVHRPEL